MDREAFGARLVGLAVVLAVVLPFLAALRWASYDQVAQYISELGAEGARDGRLVSLLFVVIGLLLLGGTSLLLSGRRWGAAVVGIALVGGGLGASYAVTGVFRCDAGCPEGAGVSTAQSIHNAAGLLGYLLPLVGLIVFGGALRRDERWRRPALVSLVAGPVLLVIGAAASGDSEVRGLAQRALELALYAWLLVVAVPYARATGREAVTPPA